MKRKDIQKYVLLLLFMVTAQLAFAQSFTLQGKVSDKDGNPIELASVMVVSQGKLSMTNLKGEFNMQLQSEDSVKVRQRGSRRYSFSWLTTTHWRRL